MRQDGEGPGLDLATIDARCRAVLGGGPGEGVLVCGPTVDRIGLALDAHPGLDGWLASERIDAVLLHRARGYVPPPGVGVIGYHDSFDEALGLHSAAVAAALGTRNHLAVGSKLALVHADPGLMERARALFGGYDDVRGGARAVVRRAALAGALRPELVTEAAAAGAQLYVTGQWRPSAGHAVERAGIAVLVVGHRRAERWALGHLGRALETALPGLRAVIDPAA